MDWSQELRRQLREENKKLIVNVLTPLTISKILKNGDDGSRTRVQAYRHFNIYVRISTI